jgi:hypothetical protein
MSTELLVAILGREAVDRMSPDALASLVQDLDAAILSDPDLRGSLTRVVTQLAGQQPQTTDAPRRVP